MGNTVIIPSVGCGGTSVIRESCCQEPTTLQATHSPILPFIAFAYADNQAKEEPCALALRLTALDPGQ